MHWPNYYIIQSKDYQTLYKGWIYFGCHAIVCMPSFKPNHGFIYGFLLSCTTMGQASDSVTFLTQSFNRWVGASCLSVAWPIVIQIEVFFSSDYL